MLAHITTIFGIDMEKSLLISLVTAVSGVGGVTIIGKTIVSNALKLIPGIGTAAGGAISASTAGALTIALGNAYIEVLTLIVYKKVKGEHVSNEEIIEVMKKEYKKKIRRTKNNLVDMKTRENIC